VCTLDVVDVEDHVNVRVDDGREIHRFHKSCFDKCTRNTTLSKLNPAQLCIFGAQSVCNLLLHVDDRDELATVNMLLATQSVLHQKPWPSHLCRPCS
jgi:hypothetical protein